MILCSNTLWAWIHNQLIQMCSIMFRLVSRCSRHAAIKVQGISVLPVYSVAHITFFYCSLHIRELQSTGMIIK